MSRGGVQGFQKERLSQALAARRLTQVQLASMVEVSPATISKWRAGTQAPEREALERLASVVNVTPEWFTRAPGPKVSFPCFAAMHPRMSPHEQCWRHASNRGQDIATALMEYVDYPAVNLPTRTFSDPDEITSGDIEAAACECRDAWRLGRSAIQDVALAVEGAGIVVDSGGDRRGANRGSVCLE